jgi:WhiB family redox-sensing transcriptional regulator
VDDLTDYELVPTSSWAARAACRGLDPELFFPARGQAAGQAKAVCAVCPVTAECAEYAAIVHQNKGIWGGLSERQRRRLVTRPKPQKLPAYHGTDSRYARGCRCDRCTEAHRAAHNERQRKVGRR